ncbi:uncharacterized protein BT62DRAFT_1012740 [Guyanagaster necrorhizus]|uniref:Uncharacterized protein n=1 Tax=Guyanagaster necrorhizus TaxID=856835 RepID=A0A9P7VGN6_9AGAR|nr:uncharacterized protein BT62DRAFT_1012740 [Guyanagaster necrorhizus MCA 3950]KAG7440379.1 hypothetical protein BT62DRAFT_1012740 [Guyanagaster necrorhizus MCA 3950]
MAMPRHFALLGLGYLCRATLSIIIIPCTAFWAIQSVLIKSGFDILAWLAFVVLLSLEFSIQLLSALVTTFTVGREAAAQGTLRLLCVQENAIAILKRVVCSFNNGYPGPSQVFREGSKKYGNTFSFGAKRVFTSEPDHLKVIFSLEIAFDDSCLSAYTGIPGTNVLLLSAKMQPWQPFFRHLYANG